MSKPQKRSLVDYSDSEDDAPPPPPKRPSSSASSDIFNTIKHCQSVRALHLLARTGVWKGRPEVRNAIIDRYNELPKPSDARLIDFATPEFWNPTGREQPSENEEPWMTEEEFRRAGGTEEDLMEEPIISPENLYEITPIAHENHKRFFMNRSKVRVVFKENDEIDYDSQAPAIWDSVLDSVVEESAPDDKIGMVIDHEILDRPIFITHHRRKDLTGRKIAEAISNVQQSRKEIKYGEEMEVTVCRAKIPRGSGYVADRQASLIAEKDNRSTSRTYVKIRNRDNSCLARAIVVGRAKIDNDKRWNSIRQGDKKRNNTQKKLAEELMMDAGVGNVPCGPEEIAMFQRVLSPKYQIKVWDNFRKLLFEGDFAGNVIHIHYDQRNHHYDVIAAIKAFHNSSYFCEYCNKAFDHQEDHCCAAICMDCHADKPCDFVKLVHCSECNRNFRSMYCFRKHQKKQGESGASICQRIQRCDKIIDGKMCGFLFKRGKDKNHICGYQKCIQCGEYTKLSEHRCYMREAERPDSSIQPSFIIFDFEATQNHVLKKGTVLGEQFLHKPNLCVAYKICSSCCDSVLDRKDFTSCSKCGENRKIFSGPNTVDDFGKWLFRDNRGTEKSPIIALAHNSKGYDSQFLLNYLIDNGYKFNHTPKGTEIMKLECNGIVIKDSLNFLPMALAQIPKAFGFTELKKGYFPHLFNTEENRNYVGPLPEHYYYGTSGMTLEARRKFFEWYSPLKQSNYQFDLKKEILEYCESDVHICTRGILKFRELVLNETGVDPIAEASTIASTTNLVFRSVFLKPKTIALIPPGGYRRQRNQSIKALKWLKWYSEKNNIRIQHDMNGGEKEVRAGYKTFKVDGYAEIEGEKIIYEFHGCVFHGCRSCYRDRKLKLFNSDKTMEDLYQNTETKIQLLRDSGYIVIEKWEHEYDKELQRNSEMKRFVDSIEIEDPLDPREALFGGRTNATKLFWKAENGIVAQYDDVCSLYPTTLYYDPFPIGHPKIITENFSSITSTSNPYRGLIKCEVNPPRKLFHPVLPFRSRKTMFPLCRTCCEFNLSDCHHSTEKRKLKGTWTHFELNKAISLGYRVLKIHEVWHWDEWDKMESDDAGLFSGYVRMWLKKKQEASGWPAWVETEEDKDKYVKQYSERMGIELDPDKIMKNPSLRWVCKLFLNSFWGKFAQRANLPKIDYLDAPEWFKTFWDDTIDIKSFNVVGSGNMARMQVRYTTKEEFSVPQDNVNVALGVFVTSHARLRLYSLLERLGDRVLYYDTDSVIYTKSMFEDNLPRGDYLGELTDELEGYGSGSYITKFCSAGPKNYYYVVWSVKDRKYYETCKVKGIPLNFTSMKHVNGKIMQKKVKAFVKNNRTEKNSIVTMRIRRLPDHRIVTRAERKTYRVVYNKRVVKNDYSTVPFGY